jgi:SAM-dependent methyltransferase
MFRRSVVALALVLFFFVHNFQSHNVVLAAAQSSAQSSTPAPTDPPVEGRKTSEPYTGDLSVFDSPGRDQRLQINRVMDDLGIASGKVVADIGAGSGWFTVRAARRVGGGGLVYAVDINPEAIRYVDERARKEKLTYHEVAQPVALLRNLRAALRSGAKVGVIDRDGNGEDHGVGRDVVIREAKEAGYQLKEQYDFVKGDKMDYFLIFIPAE